MSIYGTTLVSICLLAGMLSGKLLAILMGIDGDIGGVGLAMLFLIAAVRSLQKNGHLTAPSTTGIVFWSSIYVPIVVAMAASQDVVRAIGLVSFALFPVVKILTESKE